MVGAAKSEQSYLLLSFFNICLTTDTERQAFLFQIKIVSYINAGNVAGKALSFKYKL